MPNIGTFTGENYFIVSLKNGRTTLTCCEDELSASLEAEEIRLNYGVVRLVCSGDELLRRIMTEPAPSGRNAKD
jgi:hypothetical protein